MRVLRIVCAAALLIGGGIVFAGSGSAQKLALVHSAKGDDKPARERASREFGAGFDLHARSGLTHERARIQTPIRRHESTTRDHRRRSNVRVVRFGIHDTRRLVRVRKHGHKRSRSRPFKHFTAFSLPDQYLYPPYYRSKRPHPRGTALHSNIAGGRTVRQGSPWRGGIKGGITVEQGSRWRGHIAGGRTVEQGSRWSGHIKGGTTVQQGSRWSSHMANWRFSGHRAPIRPRGLAYFDSGPRRAAKVRRHHFPKAKLPRGSKARYRGPVVRGPTFKRVTYRGRHRH